MAGVSRGDEGTGCATNDVVALYLGPLIGRGSYGVVHRARFDGKDVAVKVVPLDGGAGTASDVKLEIECMRDLSHDSVVAIHAAFSTGGTAWIVLELCVVPSCTIRVV